MEEVLTIRFTTFRSNKIVIVYQFERKSEALFTDLKHTFWRFLLPLVVESINLRVASETLVEINFVLHFYFLAIEVI